MYKHDGPAALEFREQGIKLGIAQPAAGVTGKQSDALSLQDIQSIGYLAQRRIHVVHRHAGEEPEPAAVIGRQSRSVLVRLPRDAAARLAGHRNSRRGDGEHGPGHTCDIHVVDLLLEVPGIHGSRQVQGADRRRLIVRVNVDDVARSAGVGRATLMQYRHRHRRCQRPKGLTTRPATHIRHRPLLLIAALDPRSPETRTNSR